MCNKTLCHFCCKRITQVTFLVEEESVKLDKWRMNVDDGNSLDQDLSKAEVRVGGKAEEIWKE